jgi:hypothetical protein
MHLVAVDLSDAVDPISVGLSPTLALWDENEGELLVPASSNLAGRVVRAVPAFDEEIEGILRRTDPKFFARVARVLDAENLGVWAAGGKRTQRAARPYVLPADHKAWKPLLAATFAFLSRGGVGVSLEQPDAPLSVRDASGGEQTTLTLFRVVGGGFVLHRYTVESTSAAEAPPPDAAALWRLARRVAPFAPAYFAKVRTTARLDYGPTMRAFELAGPAVLWPSGPSRTAMRGAAA